MLQKYSTGKCIRNNLIASTIVLLFYICVNGFAGNNGVFSVMMWADAFTVTGVIFLCVSFLRKLWQSGYFDGMDYMLYAMRYLMKRERDNFLNFYDYKVTIEHIQRPVRITSGIGFILFMTGWLIVLASY